MVHLGCIYAAPRARFEEIGLLEAPTRCFGVPGDQRNAKVARTNVRDVLKRSYRYRKNHFGTFENFVQISFLSHFPIIAQVVENVLPDAEGSF